ncbi:glycosyltransferase family 2 protein [Thalassobacter stenotrophicus]|uniref:glycosyltransferase family 2 protein n=1 Tax=Thalassobacter stenotrophicus TaxID=266809 RepID=UPI0022A9363F|nr:glycosyltransferase family 2 protein [Thalassobacter stenotrophicus]UYP69871.1 glycosyltransferase family 2 protein [Thalassobacter stenotrophicus]
MTKPSSAHCVTIISVCYNSVHTLPIMLSSCGKSPVILVDNASSDVAALEDIARQYSAKLILNPTNLGFGVACNQGAKKATTEFLLFLNPDASLAPNAINELVAAAERYPRASALNPRIAETDGTPSFKRRSHLMPRSEKMARGWPVEDCDVTVLSGAALFVRRADFDAVGGFDPQIFLFHEDDDLSRRLRSERGPIMFIPSAFVTHQGGSSSGRSPKIAALKAWHMSRSRVYATRKHGMPAPFFMALLSSIRQLLSVQILLSPRKRAKQWAFFRGVLSTWRDGGIS